LTGGFDLGLERAGMECTWQVEIDQHCQSVLEKHWPDTIRHGDIKEISGDDLAAAELICGGFPCQDISVAGRRAGLAGERSGLWFEFHRVLDEHRPAWAVVENVPGLLSSNKGSDFAILLRGLEELGYGVAWRILDAQNFGVPQRRRRVFIVGHLGTYRAVQILFESEGLQGDPPPSRTPGTEIARAVMPHSGGPSGKEQQETFVTDARGLGDGKTVPTMVGDHLNRITDYTPVIATPLRSRSSLNSNIPGRGGEDDENLVIGFVPGNSADSYGIGDQEDISPPVRGGGAGAKPTVAYRKAQKAHHSEDVERWEESSVAPTLDALGHGPRTASAIAEEVGVRRLMPIECERLQGFPDGWTEGLVDTHRYRLLGNAVCVPVAEWIGRRIMQSETGGSDGLLHTHRN
jgi:DNA (cytosine-5)-methyltransferase 1